MVFTGDQTSLAPENILTSDSSLDREAIFFWPCSDQPMTKRRQLFLKDNYMLFSFIEVSREGLIRFMVKSHHVFTSFQWHKYVCRHVIVMKTADFRYKTDHISSGDLIILLEETLPKAKIMAKFGHRVGWALCLILLSFWTHQPDYSGCTCVVMKISECSFQKPFASHSWFSDSLITSLSNGTHNLLFLHFIEFPFPWTEMLHCSELNHFWEIILVICQNVLHVLCK